MTFPRWFAGYHPGFADSGIWLSAPGNDVTNVASNFLFRPDTKFDQIVLSGEVALPAASVSGVSQTIMYPAGFTKYPYIWLHAGTTFDEYPGNLSDAGSQGGDGAELTMGIQVFHDRLVIPPASGVYSTVVKFMVFYRSIGQ